MYLNVIIRDTRKKNFSCNTFHANIFWRVSRHKRRKIHSPWNYQFFFFFINKKENERAKSCKKYETCNKSFSCRNSVCEWFIFCRWYNVLTTHYTVQKWRKRVKSCIVLKDVKLSTFPVKIIWKIDVRSKWVNEFLMKSH